VPLDNDCLSDETQVKIFFPKFWKPCLIGSLEKSFKKIFKNKKLGQVL
jgi:hypothetical protein